MSAESDVSNILNSASAAAASLTGSANALVNTAIVTIQQGVAFPKPPPRMGGEPVGIAMPGEDGVPEPAPGFPRWPGLTLATAPTLQRLDKINAEFSAEFPDLALPDFDYPSVAPVTDFGGSAPIASTTITLPALPTLETGFSPDRLDSLPVVTPTLTIPDPTFAPINTDLDVDTDLAAAYSRFRTAIFGGIAGVPGLDSLLASLDALTAPALTVLLPELMALIRARLTDRYSPVLAYHADLQQRLIDRLNAERDRVLAMADDQDRSGWMLPAAARQALQAAAEQVAQAWRSHALSQHDTKTMELSLAFFEATGDLFDNLYSGYLALRKGEIEQVLEAHRMALSYAKASIAALLAEYEAKNHTKNELEQKKAEAELSLFEAHLKISMTRFEVAKAQLEAEQGRLDNDGLLIKLYQADLSKAEQDVRLYAAQVSAARSEAELKGLPQEVFALQVKAFDAQVNAHEARTRAYLAEIASDSARVDGELAKVKAFDAQAKAFAEEITAKSALISAQAERNQQVIKEYEQQAKAALMTVEYSTLHDQHTMAEYEVGLEDVLADAKIALKKAQIDLDYDNQKTAGERAAIDATQERGLELLKAELARLKAIAEVNARGAGIMAQMGEGAMSAANGVASVLFE